MESSEESATSGSSTSRFSEVSKTSPDVESDGEDREEPEKPVREVRRDRSHGRAAPLCDCECGDARAGDCQHKVYGGDRALQLLVGEGQGDCVCLDHRAWHLQEPECRGVCVCLDTRAVHLHDGECRGSGVCPGDRAWQSGALATDAAMLIDIWAHRPVGHADHLWAPRPLLGFPTQCWALDGDGGGSDDDDCDEGGDDVGLLHGRALRPLRREALLGSNGAARDMPGPGGAETLEEIYDCDWVALLPGHQGPAVLPGPGHLPSCMWPVWPILNVDETCEVGKKVVT